MPERHARAHLRDRPSAFGDQRNAASRREEIASIVESVVDSMHGDVSLENIRLYRELESLAQFIHQAKAEIARIRPDEISAQHIPTATDELDAIIAATEEATGAILDSAEAIEERISAMPSECGEKVSAAVTKIYESCNFQDITGQRISKVVGALQSIESKVDALIDAFGGELGAAIPPADSTGEAGEQKDGEGGLLNGPQLVGDGISQDDIDALLRGE